VGTLAEQWLSQLLGEAASWPEPGTRKPYWSTRTTGRSNPLGWSFARLSANFVQLIDELEANGYLVDAFGQDCVDDPDSPPSDPCGGSRRPLGLCGRMAAQAASGWLDARPVL
jgi:hypothetical protein